MARTGKRHQKFGVQQPVGRGDGHPAAGIPDYLRWHLGQQHPHHAGGADRLPHFATQTELELDKAYVLCAVSSGASRSRVLFVHILPNIIRPLVHFLCLSCAEMIMNISAFSFIGLTLGDDVIDWGSMLSEGRSMLMTHPSLLFLPILFIFLCTLAFNLLAKQLEGGEQA